MALPAVVPVLVPGDPFGFVPQFCWRSPAGWIVEPSLEAVLDAGAPPDLDYGALAVFLRLGFFLGDDTPFASIQALPSVEQPNTGPPLQISRDEAIDAFIALFRRAIRRRLPLGRFQMPLSGGRDSRHILCALADAGCPPEACVTVEHFPPRGNDDLAVAAAICARLHLRHVVLPQRHDRVRAEREKNRRTHFCTDEHAQFVALADYLSRMTPVTYDGIAGDVLSQSSYLTPEAHRCFQQRNLRRIALYILDGYGTTVSERALRRLCAPALLSESTRERAIARLERELARHLDAPNPVASFFFWNRTRREIALSPFALMRDVRVHAPYLDGDVCTLLTSLPAALLMDRRFHTDAIARAYPGVADLPYETKVKARRRPGFHRRVAIELARLLAGRPPLVAARRILPALLATALDGDPERLWHAPLTVYLAQLSALASRAR